MNAQSSYKDLIVWQKSMQLVCGIYGKTKLLPADERFGLVSQMRRAAVSIPSNIAEGRKRKSSNDFAQFLHIADGSAAELETQMLLCERIYPQINWVIEKNVLVEVQKMLAVLKSKFRAS